MALPQDTTTIEEFAESGSGITITYSNLSFEDMVSNGTIVSVHNVISDYLDELREASISVSLSYEQQYMYMYKPKLLCYDMYGNPELYFILLLINDMADVKEFNKPVIKMLRKADMSRLLTLIYNAEKKSIAEYNGK